MEELKWMDAIDQATTALIAEYYPNGYFYENDDEEDEEFEQTYSEVSLIPNDEKKQIIKYQENIENELFEIFSHITSSKNEYEEIIQEWEDL